METKQIVDSILETVRNEITMFVEEESKITSSREYEERVIEIGRNLSRQIIKGTQGKIPKVCITNCTIVN